MRRLEGRVALVTGRTLAFHAFHMVVDDANRHVLVVGAGGVEAARRGDSTTPRERSACP